MQGGSVEGFRRSQPLLGDEFKRIAFYHRFTVLYCVLAFSKRLRRNSKGNQQQPAGQE
jgi:hypothetical protein